MKIEGQVRIPSGCAISAVISKEGNKMSGELITDSMKPMHDRSNGLGGGFAGYGIYPEYKEFYVFSTGENISTGHFSVDLHKCSGNKFFFIQLQRKQNGF